ncbi:MAG: DUF2281 domain-containing protein [bacterium]
MKEIEQRIRDLPPDLTREVVDFIDGLVRKRARKTRGRLTFAWAGALKHLRGRYTSVDLQHEISKLRICENAPLRFRFRWH